MTIVTESGASYLNTTSTSTQGTTRWMSPELMNPEQFDLVNANPTRASDVYAIGMVVLEVRHIRFTGCRT